MKKTISEIITSTEVKQVAARLHLRKDEIWSIYFDSGSAYLDYLKQLIRQKRVFDTMFKFLLKMPKFGKMKPRDVILKISNSSIFWQWWSMQLWLVCRQNNFVDKTDFFDRLQFNDTLIPHFIIKKIIYGEQEHSSRQATGSKPAIEIEKVGAQAAEAGKRVESRV